MPFIRQLADHEAEGRLKRLFNEAHKRAGRVWNIVRIMSLNPETLRTSMGLYRSVMHGDSPLTRTQRELIATVVARRIGCVY